MLDTCYKGSAFVRNASLLQVERCDYVNVMTPLHGHPYDILSGCDVEGARKTLEAARISGSRESFAMRLMR